MGNGNSQSGTTTHPARTAATDQADTDEIEHKTKIGHVAAESYPAEAKHSEKVRKGTATNNYTDDNTTEAFKQMSTVQRGKARREAMESCVPAKERYDACWNTWYRYHFLKGDLRQPCDEYFDEYRVCLQEELHKKGLMHLAHMDSPESGQSVSQ